MSGFNVRSTTTAVAAALGEGWRAVGGVQTGGSDAFLVGPGDEEIHVHADEWRRRDRDRLFLSGSFRNNLYQYKPYRAPRHEITVSQAKSPAQIAREIERRLLPAYRATLAEAMANKRRSDERTAVREQLTRELAAILGVDAALDARTGTLRDLDIGAYGDELYGDVKVPHGDYHVTFKVDVSQPLAAEFAALIAGLRTSTSEEKAK